MWCHVGWQSATELHGTTFTITVIFRFNIHYLFLSIQTNSRYIQRYYKQLSHITHLPNYSSLSLTRYRMMSLKKSQPSSQHYPLCIQVTYNEMLTTEWNALRAFWCTDIGHQCSKATKEKFTVTKWLGTQIMAYHPPLTVNELLDVSAIHIFSPWSNLCCMGHKN
jgi:hypothetical protein